MTRKLRLLAFHSFRTSASIFQQQMLRAGLDKALEDLIEVVYIDAPNPASGPIPDDVLPFFQGPYYEWWNVTPTATKMVLKYADESFALAAKVLKDQGPFDGVMGFSQGGAMATLTVGLQRLGTHFQDVPPLRFCMCFAGVRVRLRELDHVYATLADLPAVHVIGDRDPVKNMTNYLIEAFKNPVVINHTRSHVVPPLKGNDLERLRTFLQAQMHISSL